MKISRMMRQMKPVILNTFFLQKCSIFSFIHKFLKFFINFAFRNLSSEPITWLKVGLSKQMFDISQFRRMTTKRDVIPSKMKDLLRKSPYVRSAAENANVSEIIARLKNNHRSFQVRRFLQKFEVFSRYPIDVQNGFSSSGWLEEFEANRVILLKGHHASCLYFILSGRC